MVEVAMEQILGVVANLRMCRDGFGHGDTTPRKGQDGSSCAARSGDTSNDGWGRVGKPSRRRCTGAWCDEGAETSRLKESAAVVPTASGLWG